MQQTAQASPLMDRSAHGGGSNGGRLSQDRLLKKPSLDTAIERFLRHQRHHLSNQLPPDMEMKNNRHCSGFIYDNSVNSILGSCSNNNGIRDTWLGFVNGLDLEESLKKKTDDQDVMGSSKDELSGSSSTRPTANRKQPKKDQSNGLIVKGQWTQDEDRVLMSLVMEYGDRNWSEVAKQLNGRVGKQCRERWNNHLRPNVKKDRWSEEEERQLIEAHEKLGNKWSEIAKYIPGRTENTIKNHWNAARRRRNSRRKKNRSASISTVLDDYIKANNLNVSGRSNPTTTTTASARGSAAAGNSVLSTTTSTEITQEDDTEFATDSLHELSQFTSYEDEVMFMQSYFNVPVTTLSYQPLLAFQQIPASEGGFPQMGYGGSSGYDEQHGMDYKCVGDEKM